jgi:quercetin dioxygenase-like cupin family protein
MKKLLLLSLAALLARSPAESQVNPNAIKWGPPPTTIPKGAQMAVISGDPSKEGIFVFRVRFPAGYVIAPHHHSTDEYVTVISGALNLGMGKKLQRSSRPNLVAGGFAHTKAGMDHYVFTRNGATIQVMGEGPFTITYVNPKDDPRNH